MDPPKIGGQPLCCFVQLGNLLYCTVKSTSNKFFVTTGQHSFLIIDYVEVQLIVPPTVGRQGFGNDLIGKISLYYQVW